MNAVVRMRGVLGWSVALSVALSVSALLGACASGDKLKPAVVQPVVKAEGKKSVTVAAEQSGAEIELGLGQELVVRLATGTAAQEWSRVDRAPGLVSGAADPKFERDRLGSTMDDATGHSIWRLRPAAAGQVELRFEYRRPRSLEPATQVVTYRVTVR